MTLWPFFILVVVYGACIGSFLNVVMIRMPAGISLVRPPSTCPRCGSRLAWHDNLPVIGWLMLRGRCRMCKDSISIQYPLVEAATAALFGLTFGCYYLLETRSGFADAGLAATWPVFLVHLVLVAGLLAATVIDARLYIIPLDIPNTVTVVALIGLPATALWLPEAEAVLPRARGPWLAAAAGGLLGLLFSYVLLRRGRLPRSFDDEPMDDHEYSGPDEWPVHPHPRREILKECLFVAWPFAGAVLGQALAVKFGWSNIEVPLPWQVAGGVAWGYLCGAALVWTVRILGTLGFGKEAMGLGDVPLLAAIGAVLGGLDAAVVFFIAPFIGLAATALIAGVGRMIRGQVRVVPYGPYLASAAFVWMILSTPLGDAFGILFGWPE